MAQIKSIYTCQNCGAQSPKWIGKCPSCNEWNSYVEEVISKKQTTGKLSVQISANQPLTLENIETVKNKRIAVPIEEFNRVLGGGIVPGSLILLGGDPGIGKSTLALQLALVLKERKILYTSGEESLLQADGAFVFIGLKPNTGFLKKSAVALDEQGFISTENGRTETSVEGVFAAGDCRRGAYAQVAAATGEGVMASYAVRGYLHGH